MIELIVNPTSGGGKTQRLLPKVRARLAELGLEHYVELTQSLDHAREVTRAALDGGRLPVSLSGDGVAGALAAVAAEHGGATIGVLPGGSGNDFCRHAGIGQDALAACTLLRDGVPTAIDLAQVNGRTFLGIASLGFDSEANALANAAPRALGRGIYLYGALAALARWKPAEFEVDVDGERHVFAGWSVVVANTSVYGGGMFIAPDARIDDGLLDVVLSAKTGRLRFLRSMPRVFNGSHVQEDSITVLRGREIRVRASRPFDVYADGDPIAQLPAEMRVLPAAVKVLLPA